MSAARVSVSHRIVGATRIAGAPRAPPAPLAAPRSSRSARNCAPVVARRGCGRARAPLVARAAEDEQTGESDPDAVAPEDYALVVELLDSETGEELKEKVDMIADNGLLTEGVVRAARVVVEQNEAAGQEPDIIELLRSVYDVLLRKFKEMTAPKAKAALEFGAALLDQFSAEDVEKMEAGETPVSIGKVKLMMQEEFEKEGDDHVDRVEFAKYLDEVLPVMTMQDERLQAKMLEVPDEDAAQRLLGVMMNRTMERVKVETLRDIAMDL
jgi:hypothetical protein